MRTIREEIVKTGSDSGLIGYYTVEMVGLLRKMNGARYAHAIYGTFERSGNTVTYTATVWAEKDGVIYHPYHSEFLDDLARFNANQCDYMN